jgi:hypothetical protein
VPVAVISDQSFRVTTNPYDDLHAGHDSFHFRRCICLAECAPRRAPYPHVRTPKRSPPPPMLTE